MSRHQQKHHEAKEKEYKKHTLIKVSTPEECQKLLRICSGLDMTIQEKLGELFQKGKNKFYEQFGFEIQETTFSKVVIYLHEPTHASSLACTRILFGLAMIFDVPDERGGAAMERRWGEPATCHFPLFTILQPAPMPYMAPVYLMLWLGAAGIMLGYKYKVSSKMFAVCFWYLLLVEKSFWNNHSYLFALVSLLLACTDAACYWSIDAYLNHSKRKETLPYWNYFILKYQFFILYFMAGMKKGTAEWLTGYSVQNLSEHWVFAPFRVFLTVAQTDYLVVHWFIFAFDLTVAAWMMWGRTRHAAMAFCSLFHLMNSRLFRIGMFPWVCLATMPLFYPFDWPKRTVQFICNGCSTLRSYLCFIPTDTSLLKCKEDYCEVSNKSEYYKDSRSSEVLQADIKTNDESTNLCKRTDRTLENGKNQAFAENNEKLVEAFLDSSCKDFNKDRNEEHKINEPKQSKYSDVSKKFTVFMILFHILTQAFLPFSHFITKGYNNWTDGLYGYSWDMMVHTWDPHSVVIKVVDNDRNKQFYIDPHTFAPNDRWSRHGDMVHQYAHCLKNSIEGKMRSSKDEKISANISIYVDVWCAINGRFAQRMFDPKVDILKATWSPFEPVPYLMPLLDGYSGWRVVLDKIREKVQAWSNQSDVTFYADFPGYSQEKYIPKELRNITITVLEGLIAYEPELTRVYNGQSTKLVTGDRMVISSESFHRVLNIGESPAFYMYTFYNSTEPVVEHQNDVPKPKLPIGTELALRFINMIKFCDVIMKSVLQIFFRICRDC